MRTILQISEIGGCGQEVTIAKGIMRMTSH